MVHLLLAMGMHDPCMHACLWMWLRLLLPLGAPLSSPSRYCLGTPGEGGGGGGHDTMVCFSRL